MGLIEAVPYNTKIERQGLTFRYTDAGHILGSAMVEVWVDGMKLLFCGDIGPDHSPILCKPTQHFGADAVLDPFVAERALERKLHHGLIESAHRRHVPRENDGVVDLPDLMERVH